MAKALIGLLLLFLVSACGMCGAKPDEWRPCAPNDPRPGCPQGAEQYRDPCVCNYPWAIWFDACCNIPKEV